MGLILVLLVGLLGDARSSGYGAGFEGDSGSGDVGDGGGDGGGGGE